VKFTRDGHLAVFDQPGDAVRVSRNLSEFADSLGLPVRIGIHVGEVEVLDAEVLGVAVVIATRVMALGGPGDVIATVTVVDLVDGAGHRWEPIGTHELKGIDRPRELWRLQGRAKQR
jgi:class 3 adenylate cyclase